jgi:hypothetical protein
MTWSTIQTDRSCGSTPQERCRAGRAPQSPAGMDTLTAVWWVYGGDCRDGVARATDSGLFEEWRKLRGRWEGNWNSITSKEQLRLNGISSSSLNAWYRLVIFGRQNDEQLCDRDNWPGRGESSEEIKGLKQTSVSTPFVMLTGGGAQFVG